MFDGTKTNNDSRHDSPGLEVTLSRLLDVHRRGYDDLFSTVDVLWSVHENLLPGERERFFEILWSTCRAEPFGSKQIGHIGGAELRKLRGGIAPDHASVAATFALSFGNVEQTSMAAAPREKSDERRDRRLKAQPPAFI